MCLHSLLKGGNTTTWGGPRLCCSKILAVPDACEETYADALLRGVSSHARSGNGLASQHALGAMA